MYAGAISTSKKSGTSKARPQGVLYVTRSKNETSKRPIPLNEAAKEAVERMLRRADTLDTRTRITTFGVRVSTTS